MYKTLNVIPEIIEAASDVVVKNDRMLYVDYYRLIEDFAFANHGIIGGNIASQLILGEPVGKDSFSYEIYFDNANEMARKLIEKLTEINNQFVKPRYIFMDALYRGREINIYVDLRLIAVILTPASYKSIPITKLMGVNTVDGHFAPSANVVPVEYLLIDIYRKLYSPRHVEEWEHLYHVEDELYKLVAGELKQNVLEKIAVGVGFSSKNHGGSFSSKKHSGSFSSKNHGGGGDNGSDDGGDSGSDIDIIDGGRSHKRDKRNKRNKRDSVGDGERGDHGSDGDDDGDDGDSTSDNGSERGDGAESTKREMVEIILTYIKNTDFVLIGDYADASPNDNSRLQLISALPISTIIADFTRALSVNKQIKLTHTHAIVTADIRVTKYSISAMFKQSLTHICDIYTSAMMEPIPFVDGVGKHKNIKIGSLYVRARFCLIDLWSMKLIINQNRLQGLTAQEKWSAYRITTLLNIYRGIKKQIKSAKITDLFQYSNYVGGYEDIRVTKRNMYPGHPQTYNPTINKSKTN
jgi:hypothetical protein